MRSGTGKKVYRLENRHQRFISKPKKTLERIMRPCSIRSSYIEVFFLAHFAHQALVRRTPRSLLDGVDQTLFRLFWFCRVARTITQ